MSRYLSIYTQSSHSGDYIHNVTLADVPRCVLVVRKCRHGSVTQEAVSRHGSQGKMGLS